MGGVHLLTAKVATLSKSEVREDLDGAFFFGDNSLDKILDGNHTNHLPGLADKRKLCSTRKQERLDELLGPLLRTDSH